MNNMCALINLFLIASMVHVGMAIKCFNCDSSTNENCANMTDKNLLSEECTTDKLGGGNTHDDRKHWVLRISDINYHNLNQQEAPMACQKIVGIDENRRQTTVRRCQLSNVSPCNFSVSKVVNQNREIAHCSLCHEDGCNGSSNNQVFGVMIGVVTTITIFMQLIL